MTRARWLVPVLVLALAGCASPGNVRFQPPDAPILAGADCGTDDVVQALAFGERGPQADAAGGPTIDTVRLEGDMAPVLDAFRGQSIRLPEGSIASCAIAEYPASGLWLLDAAGQAVRPAWPSRVCGFQQPPLAALAGLREVGRESAPVDGPAQPGPCRVAPYFPTTTVESELSWRGSSAPVQDQLRIPVDDVDALTMCGSAASRVVPRAQSRALLAAVAVAPGEGR